MTGMSVSLEAEKYASVFHDATKNAPVGGLFCAFPLGRFGVCNLDLIDGGVR